MTNDPHCIRQRNKQTKEDKSKSSNNINNNNSQTSNKTNQEIDFFITETGMETYRNVSEKTTLNMH